MPTAKDKCENETNEIEVEEIQRIADHGGGENRPLVVVSEICRSRCSSIDLSSPDGRRQGQVTLLYQSMICRPCQNKVPGLAAMWARAFSNQPIRCGTPLM